MIYRDFGKTGLRVSAIGMGCEYVWTADEKQIFDLVRAAVDAGINYFDLFVGTPTTREYYGKALKGVRDKICLAGHLGCADKDGQYVKTRDEALCKDFLRQFYEKLDTDYIDVLFLHNCDDEADLNEILNGWMYAYAKELKDTGRVGFIGLSSHNTKIALNAVKSGKIDVLMFPVNPLFNLLPQDTADARMKGREVKSMTEEE
ncbi:MAG: aldo/keto reductase, partial [Lachnospiraceae bacterium]